MHARDRVGQVGGAVQIGIPTFTGSLDMSTIGDGSQFLGATGGTMVDEVCWTDLHGTTTVTTDNGVDNDDNGMQPHTSAATTSPIITLASGTETGSGNTDNTIDFGFTTPAPACKILFLCGEAKPAMCFGHPGGGPAKIDDGFESKLIQTVRGMGYVLEESAGA